MASIHLPSYTLNRTRANSPAPSSWLTIDDASAWAHVAPSHLREAIAAGELRAALVDGQLVVHEAWLHAWRLTHQSVAALDFRMAAAADGGDAA